MVNSDVTRRVEGLQIKQGQEVVVLEIGLAQEVFDVTDNGQPAQSALAPDQFLSRSGGVRLQHEPLLIKRRRCIYTDAGVFCRDFTIGRVVWSSSAAERA